MPPQMSSSRALGHGREETAGGTTVLGAEALTAGDTSTSAAGQSWVGPSRHLPSVCLSVWERLLRTMRPCTAQPLAQASDSIPVVPALLRDKPGHSPACVREGWLMCLKSRRGELEGPP